MLNCNLFLWSKLYFQHHYSSLQCHMIFRNHTLNLRTKTHLNFCQTIIKIWTKNTVNQPIMRHLTINVYNVDNEKVCSHNFTFLKTVLNSVHCYFVMFAFPWPIILQNRITEGANQISSGSWCPAPNPASCDLHFLQFSLFVFCNVWQVLTLYRSTSRVAVNSEHLSQQIV